MRNTWVLLFIGWLIGSFFGLQAVMGLFSGKGKAA